MAATKQDLAHVEGVLDRLHETCERLPELTRKSTQAKWMERVMLFHNIVEGLRPGVTRSVYIENLLNQLARHQRDAQAEVDFFTKPRVEARR